MQCREALVRLVLEVARSTIKLSNGISMVGLRAALLCILVDLPLNQVQDQVIVLTLTKYNVRCADVFIK